MAGLTVAKLWDARMGLPDDSGRIIGEVLITFDSSYPTNGEVIAATDIDANYDTLECLWQAGVTNGASTAHLFVWDQENGKILAYDVTAEIGNTTDLSGSAARFMFIAS